MLRYLKWSNDQRDRNEGLEEVLHWCQEHQKGQDVASLDATEKERRELFEPFIELEKILEMIPMF